MPAAGSGQIGTAVAAASGALVGGWMEAMAHAGGAWILAGSMAAAALWEAFQTPRHAPAEPEGFVAGMNCATLGGFVGGVLAYALSHAGPGPVTAHAAGASATPQAHLQMLGMLAMNGAMGAMIGHATATCPRMVEHKRRGLKPGRGLQAPPPPTPGQRPA